MSSLTGAVRGLIAGPARRLKLKEKYLAWKILRALLAGSSGKDGRLPILIINHHFDQDIAALRHALNGRPDAAVIQTIAPNDLYALARCYLPDSASDFYGYVDPALAAGKAALRALLVGVLRTLKKRRPRLVFVSPSDQFFWIREFVAACKAVGLPFIVLDKEGTISPLFYETQAELIKRYMPPICDYVLVWSERQKEYYRRSGFPDPAGITVVGQPRSDFWNQPERWAERGKLFRELDLDPEKKTILYFDFESDNYIKKEMFDRGYNWDALLADIHAELCELARRAPQINIIFKVHPQARNLEQVRAQIAAANAANVRLVTGAALSNDLIVQADLTVGFHSTAMLEAMLTAKPLIYTYWGKAPESKQDLIPFDENRGIEVAISRDDFRRRLETHVNNGFKSVLTPELKRERRKLTEVFFFQPDGHVSERVLARIAGLAAEYHRER
ncbi:MAG: CDP-glycerol glycerophosphotransferase family protein [Candidatus Margulisiibacteriota bacterium]